MTRRTVGGSLPLAIKRRRHNRSTRRKKKLLIQVIKPKVIKPKSTKTIKVRTQKGGALAALALPVAKFIGPIIAGLFADKAVGLFKKLKRKK